MKFKKNLLLVGIIPVFLCSCGGDSGSEITSSSSEAISSSFTPDPDSPWDEELQRLMTIYCGEILPYPTGLLTGNISYSVVADSNNKKMLKITDESTSFTIEKYYQTLRDQCGWTSITSFNGKHKRRVNDEIIYEVTKSSNGKGYDVAYAFHDAVEASEFTEAAPAYNVIYCRNYCSSEFSADTDWNNEDFNKITYAITESLPFIQMGDDYKVDLQSEDTVLIYDYSTTDLSNAYAKLLVEDGYEVSPALSAAYDRKILTKKLDDESFISASVGYMNGNIFKFDYSAKPKKTPTWPSDALAWIEGSTGFKIPQFTSSDISYYYSYEKNNKVYVYAETQTNFEFETDYYTQLANIGLIDDGWGNFADWEENISLKALTIYNQYESFSIQYAFQIIVSVPEAVSTFLPSWPETPIDSFLKSNGIKVSCPIPSLPSLSKDIKYVVNNDYDAAFEEEYSYVLQNSEALGIDINDDKALEDAASERAKKDLNIMVSLYDTRYKSFNFLNSFFVNEAYFVESIASNEVTFEDPTGAMKIILSKSNYGVTTVTISRGSGIEHKPVFEFRDSKVTLGKGASKQLELNISMLPYGVSYSSSDASGKISVNTAGLVSVANDAIIGSKATITAYINVPGESSPRSATCEVTVGERSSYTYKSALEAAVKLLNAYRGYEEGSDDALYACYDSSNDFYYVLTNFVGDSGSLDTLKAAVLNLLVPAGFNLTSDWAESTSDHDRPVYTRLYSADSVALEYSITLNNGVTLFQIKSYSSSK